MFATVLMVIGAGGVAAVSLWRLLRGDGTEPTRWSRAEAVTTLLFAVAMLLTLVVSEPWRLLLSVSTVVLALLSLTFVLVGHRSRRAGKQIPHG